ncbi:MAG: hypothetical protein KDI88_06945 [Gammaproteobacteria bacterium]|nr:hypothetical protein [Gammaproteobacteria bacterium]
MTTDYHPIGCDQHSVLELLALRQVPVEVQAITDDGAPSTCSGRVSDLLTRGGAEYLVVRDAGGQTTSIRLDRLVTISRRDGDVLWRRESVV